ncbi:hypothetical protein, partial [Aeromonas salmonicida]|uniref:hypothetical protein n=1 Tax=Aeromonas salmonicida TaxID=645 RepID=UPI003D323884
ACTEARHRIDEVPANSMLPAGDVQLTLGAGAGSAMRQLPLTIHGGRTTLVWVQRLGAGLTCLLYTSP